MSGAVLPLTLYTFMVCTGKIFPFWMLEAKFRKATVTFVISVCLSTRNNSASTGRIFMKLDILVFLETLLRKFQLSLKSDKNNGYFT